MTEADEFYASYADALRGYLATRDEASLAVGHELGRRALRERRSMLDIIERHFELVDSFLENLENSESDGTIREIALQFLLQTLTTLDFASRGFLDRTKRYEQERARAESLAHRDQFRSALVNSLQAGFFVADSNAAVVEINDAFTEITGYPAQGLPYRWPYPWVPDEAAADGRLSRLFRIGHIQYETPIRHRDGHTVWVAMNANAVTDRGAGRNAYVGTVRDITAARAAAERESAVLRLATAVSVAKTVEELLSATLGECRRAVDAQRVVTVQWPPGGGDPAVEAAGEPAVSAWGDLDAVLQQTLQEARGQLPLSVQSVEFAGVPGQSRGIVAVLSGTEDMALWLEFRIPRQVSSEDRLLVAALVGHLGLGLQHVRQFEMARDTSLTLQRAILTPGEPPTGFAVRYEPAVSPLEIGGDWYDVMPITDRQTAIIVGDCVGRGLSAAAVMGQLRSSARALLLTGAEPARVLEQLDSVAALIPNAVCTTAFVAILDAESATLRYSCAGHLPAVLATPEAGMAVLDDARSVPLAVHRNDARPQAAAVLAPGSTLVFYTDGLVERRRESLDDGIARLGAMVAAMTTSTVDSVADAVVHDMAPADGYDDDVALVVYRHPPDPLVIDTDATAGQLREVRHQLAAWLGAANIPATVSADIVTAVNEACENSVEHAYRGRNRGTMHVAATITCAQIQVQVADFGSWKAPPHDPGHRGRGLSLIRALSDRFELDHRGSGTTADMSFRTSAGLADSRPASAPAGVGVA
ncbi:MAG TPA: SpoIIE family protein phosphatase [Mycobacterium sp.]|nr:SpoIIE family protein phosphatase [Mycobacterium sp.]